MRGHGRSVHPSDVPAGLDHQTGCSPPTSIDTDDPTFETAEYRFGHRPLGCGLGHDPCFVFRLECRLWKRPDIRRARLCWAHSPWSRRDQAIPADLAAMADGGDRGLPNSQAGRRGHALGTLCPDVADATDRLDRRLVDGMLHGRSGAAEHRPSRLRPFHRSSGQRDDGLSRSCLLCLDASRTDFAPRDGGAFPSFCLSRHDSCQNDSSPWTAHWISFGLICDREFAK